jgi:hypothetical protein
MDTENGFKEPQGEQKDLGKDEASNLFNIAALHCLALEHDWGNIRLCC